MVRHSRLALQWVPAMDFIHLNGLMAVRPESVSIIRWGED